MSIRELAEQQYQRHLDTDRAPRIVPRTVFLPKDRDAALRMIAEFLHFAIRDERMNYMTGVGPEVEEIIDLIERS